MRKIGDWLLIFLALAAASAWADTPHLESRVQVEGESVIVDIRLPLPVTRQQAWAVLTDYDHMARFISNLSESKVITTSGDTVNVFQRGIAQYGLVSFPFESTREVHLTPFEKIQSHRVSGTMKKMEGVTELREEKGQVWLIYHAESIPGVWIPPIVGKNFIEHETREQFREMRDEMIRRNVVLPAN